MKRLQVKGYTPPRLRPQTAREQRDRARKEEEREDRQRQDEEMGSPFDSLDWPQ